MTSATPNAVAEAAPHSWKEPWASFAAWAATELGLVLEFDGEAYQLAVLADAQPATEDAGAASKSGIGSAILSLRRKRADDGGPEPAPTYASPSEVVGELLDRLDQAEHPPNTAPVDQPEYLHDLAAQLLGAYEAEHGGLHITGCHFEGVPFVRVTSAGGGEDAPTLTHTLYDADGTRVSSDTAAQLGLTETKALPHRPAPPAGFDPHSAKRAHGDAAARVTAVVWAKRVEGHIQFTAGDATLSIPFAGWARTLAAPPAVCPETGRETFRLTTLDDGRIVAAEEVGACDASGRRVLLSELVTCATTGKRVRRDLCDVCPISGEPVLREEFVECPACRERVGGAEIVGGACSVCRGLARAGASDARLAALLEAHPGLARLRRVRVGETRDVYVVQGRRRLAKHLVVLDKHDLRPRHAARAGLVGARWKDLSVAETSGLLAGHAAPGG